MTFTTHAALTWGVSDAFGCPMKKDLRLCRARLHAAAAAAIAATAQAAASAAVTIATVAAAAAAAAAMAAAVAGGACRTKPLDVFLGRVCFAPGVRQWRACTKS